MFVKGLKDIIIFYNRLKNSSENSMYSFSNFQNGNNKKEIATILYRFDNITDLKSIKSVTVGDITAFINQTEK